MRLVLVAPALALAWACARPAPRTPAASCERTGPASAIAIPRDAWQHRTGAAVIRLRDVRSSKDRPVEMCGIPQANHWLMALRCDDRSRPIASEADAERARPGNVGPGGRCRSIIDRYVVPCPEARYELFVDSYVCPR